jgi:hypothetical protein
VAPSVTKTNRNWSPGLRPAGVARTGPAAAGSTATNPKQRIAVVMVRQPVVCRISKPFGGVGARFFAALNHLTVDLVFAPAPTSAISNNYHTNEATAAEMSRQPYDVDLQRQLTAAALSRAPGFAQAIQRFLFEASKVAFARAFCPLGATGLD